MSGLDLRAIREGLAAQIQTYVTRGTTVHAYDPGDHAGPAIIIRAASGEYVSYFSTMGGNGYAEVFLTLELDPAATRPADQRRAIDDYLAVGTGNTSSVVDAIHSDRTIGGLVSDVVCLTADIADDSADTDPVAVLHVRCIVKKVSAQP